MLKLKFDQGTLLLEGVDRDSLRHFGGDIPWVWDQRVSQFRTDGLWYRRAVLALRAAGQPWSDDVFIWQKMDWPQINFPSLRPEQQTAVDAWFHTPALAEDEELAIQTSIENQSEPAATPALDRTGLIVMPTGTGKTIVALSIAASLKTGCLFVAPVRDLMYQWQRRIKQHLGYDAGVIGDACFNVKPVSVTTYDSAAIHANRLGNQFGLIVFDECHHLPGNFFRDAALMSAAPFRLGLTATPHRADGRHADFEHLIGPTVYEMEIASAAGSTLAEYEIVKIPVTLSPSEQTHYDQLSTAISDYVYQRRQEDDQFTWQQLCQESNSDVAARQALKSFRHKEAIENRATEKLRVLEDLFRLHAGEPTLVFVGSNSMARDVSLRFLIPCLLAHCGKHERSEILEGFENGLYPAIVANQILDEGVDLPDVKVAIVIGGSSSTRQAKQRLGRILRKSKFGRAILYEVVLSTSGETKRSRARTKNDAYKNLKRRK